MKNLEKLYKQYFKRKTKYSTWNKNKSSKVVDTWIHLQKKNIVVSRDTWMHKEKTVLSGRRQEKKLNQSTKPIFFIVDKVKE